MTFTVFQIIVVGIPAVVGAFAVVMVTLGVSSDEMTEPSVRFGAPFILGVWLICTIWAFWPMVMG
ncbi:hypothetical protein LCGC14_0504660 [marine sediment metagenome]|uniref:Uncharacterized protein n=1 Tax=marine sediment metagenome TaxID=412755 RepID=A0A0F9UPU5_9ZZZZ